MTNIMNPSSYIDELSANAEIKNNNLIEFYIRNFFQGNGKVKCRLDSVIEIVEICLWFDFFIFLSGSFQFRLYFQLRNKSSRFACPATKSDEFQEKFQTAFNPPPHFRKIILQTFFGKRPKKNLFKGPKPTIYIFNWKWPRPPFWHFSEIHPIW